MDLGNLATLASTLLESILNQVGITFKRRPLPYSVRFSGSPELARCGLPVCDLAEVQSVVVMAL
jgi:hypothetical protein